MVKTPDDVPLTPKNWMSGFLLATVICFLHVAAFRFVHDRLIFNFTANMGIRGFADDFLDNMSEPFLIGVIFAEVSCLAIWVNLSRHRMKFKIQVYCWFSFLMSLLAVDFGALFLQDIGGWLYFIALEALVIAYSTLALRLSSCRLQIVEGAHAGGNQVRHQFTLSQALFAMTAIGFFLWKTKYPNSASSISGLLVHTAIVGFLFSFISVCSLWIAITIHRIAVQAILMLVIVVSLSILHAIASPASYALGWLERFLIFAPSAILPLMLVKLAHVSIAPFCANRGARSFLLASKN